MGSSTVAAWATKTECFMMTMFTAQPGPMDKLPEACTSPQLAIDSATQIGHLVFEGNDGIHILETSHVRFVDASKLLRAGGTSPRVLFDGQRFWVSYLDASGQIVVGYLDGSHLNSTTVVGPNPGARGYDLAMIAGQVWVVAFDGSGYSASRLCRTEVD
jgi:hypothetical protein